MNKLSTCILISLLFVSMFMFFSPVHGLTLINEDITSDTTWTKAGSPYTIKEPVHLIKGITLTVEPGTVINIENSGYLQIEGILIARGNPNDRIHITGSRITFTESAGAWNEDTSAGCIIENAEINEIKDYGTFAMEIIGVSVKFNANIINAKICSYNGAPIITNNIITGDVEVHGGSAVISNNKITKEGITFSETDQLDALVTNNIISDVEGQGIYVSMGNELNTGDYSIVIEKNYIYNTGCGISIVCMMSPVIRFNTIMNNSRGISLLDFPGKAVIEENNIFNNTYNLSLLKWMASDVNASNNYWGTTNTKTIDALIYDKNEKGDLGTVIYTPILSNPVSEAPTDDSIVLGSGSSIYIPFFQENISLVVTAIIAVIVIAWVAVMIIFFVRRRKKRAGNLPKAIKP